MSVADNAISRIAKKILRGFFRRSQARECALALVTRFAIRGAGIDLPPENSPAGISKNYPGSRNHARISGR